MNKWIFQVLQWHTSERLLHTEMPNIVKSDLFYSYFFLLFPDSHNHTSTKSIMSEAVSAYIQSPLWERSWHWDWERRRGQAGRHSQKERHRQRDRYYKVRGTYGEWHRERQTEKDRYIHREKDRQYKYIHREKYGMYFEENRNTHRETYIDTDRERKTYRLRQTY